MASRQNQKKIGEEGFKMIDQAEANQRCIYYPTNPTVHYLQQLPVTEVNRISIPPPKSNYSQHQLHKPATTVCQTRPNPITNNITSNNCNNPRPAASAVHTYVTPSPVTTTRDQATTGVMDCYEAARRYGGMVVTDYYPANNMVMKQRGNSKAY